MKISGESTIVKYISTEIRKCDLGESSIMESKVSCGDIAVYNKIARAVAGPNHDGRFRPNSVDNSSRLAARSCTRRTR